MVKPLQIIFNKSLALGQFPKQWKHAHVIPIFKKGDNSSPENYRPVSLLSCIGKIFERVVFKYVYNYLHENDLLYNLQAGFRPGHSTVTQLIEIYHNVCLALENKEMSCFTFCDISKAFDRVWVKGLIFKLQKYGFRGQILTWLSDYLQNRTQQVKIEHSVSTVGRLWAGVPQGSVLGPLLFLTYINDLPDGLLGLTRLFADDTSNSHRSSSTEELQTATDYDFSAINTWSNNWLVKFNLAKTKILIFGASETQKETTTFTFDNSVITPVTTHKHLGIIFSDNGKWTAHIDAITAKLSKQIAVLRKLKYKITREFLSNMYITFIRPTMEYASEVWDNLTQFDADRLEKFQLEAARIVTGLPSYCSRSVLYFETGWETLAKRREKRKLTLLYKIKNGISPDYLSELLPPTIGDNMPCNLRHNNDIQIPYCRLNIYKNSFFPSTISRWNKLPLATRNSISVNQFKSRLNASYQNSNRSKFFLCGCRKLNVLHTKIRHGCSQLNSDLARINLKPNSSCTCGHPREDASH